MTLKGHERWCLSVRESVFLNKKIEPNGLSRRKLDARRAHCSSFLFYLYYCFWWRNKKENKIQTTSKNNSITITLFNNNTSNNNY